MGYLLKYQMCHSNITSHLHSHTSYASVVPRAHASTICSTFAAAQMLFWISCPWLKKGTNNYFTFMFDVSFTYSFTGELMLLIHILIQAKTNISES